MSECGDCITLPESWSICSIGQVTDFPIRLDPRHEPDREIRYVDISSINNVANTIIDAKRYRLGEAPSRARQIVSSGDILFATVRPYLRNIAQVGRELDGQIASTGFAVLRPESGVDPRFLYYQVLSCDFVDSLSRKQYGVSYPAVKDEQVRDQHIALAPYGEQCRIVAKIEALFSELDKGIESLETARKQLQVYRQALLKQALEGRLTADWREAHATGEETQDQLNQAIQGARASVLQRRMEQWQTTVNRMEQEKSECSLPSK
ncbi:MAG: hypothetical protein VBE63_22320, partial [Lamprobacter sp.]|nr:hypothetical protein [Lamprobacter sp.]